MTRQTSLTYGMVTLLLIGLVVACAQPEKPKHKVDWQGISHGGHIRKDKPYKQSGFGDCDAKDLINFTCE